MTLTTNQIRALAKTVRMQAYLLSEQVEKVLNEAADHVDSLESSIIKLTAQLVQSEICTREKEGMIYFHGMPSMNWHNIVKKVH